MSALLRATTLVGKPVLTLDGESPVEVKDVVFDTGSGRILGFTMRKHGFLGGPVSETLAWSDVHGLGPDAIVVADATKLTKGDGAMAGGGDVIGDRIITESGTDLGVVVEVVVATGSAAEVVGFEIESTSGDQSRGAHHVFIPMPDTLAISGENIVVPDTAEDFIRDDLSGFGSAVDEFRSKLAGKVT